jgi:carbon storage regulator
MLVLSRKPGTSIVVGDTTITVLAVEGRSVRLGFDAPPKTKILRGELRTTDASPKDGDLSGSDAV